MVGSQSELIGGAIQARSTGGTVEYRALVPTARRPGERLPLILHLHGAMSSAASLDKAKDAYDLAWASGDLPPALIACASTPTLGGFYIDQRDGPAWETFIGAEFPAHLERAFDLSGRRAAIGFSMGGYGALKLAFRNPDVFTAVAALCPVVFPAETSSAVPKRNRPSILEELNRAMGEDEEAYRGNSIYGLLRANGQKVRQCGTHIYFDCGAADEFHLHDGADHLHGVLTQLGIPHEFRSIANAGHADEHAPSRQAEAIRFLGCAFTAEPWRAASSLAGEGAGLVR